MFGFIFSPLLEALVTKEDDEYILGLWESSKVTDEWSGNCNCQSQDELPDACLLLVALVEYSHTPTGCIADYETS